MRRLLPLALVIACAAPETTTAPDTEPLLARSNAPTVEDLGVAAPSTINGGPGITEGNQVNDDGYVAGLAEDYSLLRRPFVWREGVFEFVEFPEDRNPDQSRAFGISHWAHVVGGASPRRDLENTGVVHPFRWHDGHTDVLTSVVGYASATNRQGVAVGVTYVDSPACCETRAFLWGFPDAKIIAALNQAVDITDGGVILGRVGQSDFVLWKNQVLHTLPAGFAPAHVNEKLMVLGAFVYGEAVLWQSSGITTLERGGVPVSGVSLSNNGTVVGHHPDGAVAWCKGNSVILSAPEGSTFASVNGISPNGRFAVGTAFYPAVPTQHNIRLVRWTLPSLIGQPGPRC